MALRQINTAFMDLLLSEQHLFVNINAHWMFASSQFGFLSNFSSLEFKCFFFYGCCCKAQLRKPCTPWKINFERGPKGTVKVYFTNLQVKVYFTNLQVKVYFTKGGFPLSRNFNWLYVRKLKQRWCLKNRA